MKTYKVFYKSIDFPNKNYDKKRLENQIKGHFKNLKLESFSGGVQIVSETPFRPRQLEKIDKIILKHDAKPLFFLQKETIERRRYAMQSILSMAYDRADLRPFFDSFQKYFNYINKEIDGYIYYSSYQILIDTIKEDKEEGEPFSELLNSVVRKGRGGKQDELAFQFLINSIEKSI